MGDIVNRNNSSVMRQIFHEEEQQPLTQASFANVPFPKKDDANDFLKSHLSPSRESSNNERLVDELIATKAPSSASTEQIKAEEPLPTTRNKSLKSERGRLGKVADFISEHAGKIGTAASLAAMFIPVVGPLLTVLGLVGSRAVSKNENGIRRGKLWTNTLSFGKLYKDAKAQNDKFERNRPGADV